VARIRTLKPELWMSPQVMNLSTCARLLFVGLITQADDEGRGSADPRRLKAAIFGGDDTTRDQVAQWLGEVSAQGLAVLYDGGPHGALYELTGWRAHQCINRPTPSHYPKANGSSAPKTPPASTGNGHESPPISEHSRSTHGTITEDSRKTHEGSDLKDRKEGSIDPPAKAPRARESQPSSRTIFKNRVRDGPGLRPIGETLEAFTPPHRSKPA
jgi:hypothetical protein